MTPIAAMVERLIAAGCAPAEAASVVAEAFAFGVNSTGIPPDSAAEKRRAYDRARKRRSTGIPPESTGIPVRHIIEESNTKKDIIRAQRISAEWILPHACRSWALLQGLSESEVDDESQRFKDFWIAKAGRDGAKRDWPATWRNWCRNFLERKGRSLTTGPPAVTPEQREYLRKADEIRREREKRKLNGKASSEATVDGNGTQGDDHQGELLPSG